jgi:hypothetical protein
MIRTMQLVAQLERSCVGFRSNSVIWIRKNAKSSELTIFSGIHCRHYPRMPFSGIRGFRQARGQSSLVHGRLNVWPLKLSESRQVAFQPVSSIAAPRRRS